MAVAHEAYISSSAEFREAAGDPNGNPKTMELVATSAKGVVVAIYSEIQGMAAASNAQVEACISGVTCEGIAMTKVGFARSTSTEELAIWFYELVSGVPSGSLTIVITQSANPEPATGVFPWFWAEAASMTATGAAVQRSDSDTLGNSSTHANPSITMNNGTRTAHGYLAGMSGASVLANITPGTGMTQLNERQMAGASKSAYFYYTTTAASGDVAMGATIATDDAVLVGASYAELDASDDAPFIGGGFF